MTRIRFQPSGREITSEEGETVLDAALRSGLVVPYSCRSGNCGICRGRLISGEIAPGAEPEQVLGPDARARGEVLLCQAQPRSNLVVEAQEVEAVAGIEVRTLPCRVTRLQRHAHDVTGITLSLPRGRGTLRFLAGQFIDLLLWDGRRRSYSIASPPDQTEAIELHVQWVTGGAFSEQALCELKEQDLLRFIGPLGTFFLREDTRPAILIAGGTGIAPLEAMIEDLRASGKPRQMQLYWGVRSRRDLYRLERVRAWEQDLGIAFTPVLSEPDDDWNGRRGFVHEAALADHHDLSGVQVYASGPPAMIAAIREVLPRHGLAADALFYESFEYAVDPAGAG